MQIETTVEARLELLEHCLAPDVELDEAILGRVHKGIDAIETLAQDQIAKARFSQLAALRCRPGRHHALSCSGSCAASALWPRIVPRLGHPC